MAFRKKNIQQEIIHLQEESYAELVVICLGGRYGILTMKNSGELSCSDNLLKCYKARPFIGVMAKAKEMTVYDGGRVRSL